MKKFEDGSIRSTGVLVKPKQKPSNAAKDAAADVVEAASTVAPRTSARAQQDAQLKADLDELHRRQHADDMQEPQFPTE